jgi:hypothetical protein
MACKRCQSSNQNTFEGEINIQFREFEKLEKLPVLSFATLLICMDCGFVESSLSDAELQELIQSSADRKKASG